MLVRTSRAPRPGSSTPLYLGGCAVLVSELLKLPTCLALIARDEGGLRGMAREVKRSVFDRWRDTLRMGVPALCYGAQNLLFFVALSNLSATSYQLWSQTKTLFTALFFVAILKQPLRPIQWAALGVLTAGVGIVQLDEAAVATAAGAAGAAGAASSAPVGGAVLVGIAAVLASSILSGFANIYFEKVLKQAECEFDESCELEGANTAPMSLWTRNVQLALFSIPQAAALLLLSSSARATIAAHGALVGFTPLVWGVTALTAGGGLLIAAVVKHADNVLKTFATATAIVATCSITAVRTGVPPTPGFLQGLSLVLASMAMYNSGGRAAAEAEEA